LFKLKTNLTLVAIARRITTRPNTLHPVERFSLWERRPAAMARPQSADIHAKGGAQQTLATFWRCSGRVTAVKHFQCSCDTEGKTVLNRVKNG
jgi:hypothetical protein